MEASGPTCVPAPLGVADGERPRAGDEPLGEALGDLARDVHALDRPARLAAPAHPAHSAPSAARPMWQSASTSIASLPPSSTVTSFSRLTHARATSRPTAGEPVNRTFATGAPASATPTRASPCASATSPSGRSARASTRAIRSRRQAGAGGRLEDDAVARQQRPRDLASGWAKGALPAPITPITP